DLNPWATAGLATALDHGDPDELERAGQEWCAVLELVRHTLYGGPLAGAEGTGETLTTFWVRTTKCPHCETLAYLYPYSLITLASRSAKETHAYFGCNACGTITKSRRDTSPRRCSGCRRHL